MQFKFCIQIDRGKTRYKLTDDISYRKQVFGTRLHWYWQPRQI